MNIYLMRSASYEIANNEHNTDNNYTSAYDNYNTSFFLEE